MRKVLASILLSVVVTWGCGGGASAPVTTAPVEPGAPAPGGHEHGEHGGHEHGEHGGHHGLPPELHAFHEVLAPLWHAEPGAQRDADVCAGAGKLDAQAKAVAGAGTPAGVDALAWTAGVEKLQADIATLTSECASKGAASVATTFPPLHDAFHHLMELLPKT